MIVLKRKAKPTERVLFSPDGKSLAVAGGRRKPLELWSVHDPNAPKFTLDVQLDRADLHFAFSPTGDQIIAVSDDALDSFDTHSGQQVWGFMPEESSCIGGLDVSADGHIFLGKIHAYMDDAPFQCWRLAGAAEPDRQWTVKKAPDSEWMCRGVVCLPRIDHVGFAEYTPHPYASRIVLRSASSGRRVSVLECGDSELKQIAVSDDGRWLGALTARAISVWSTTKFNTAPTVMKNASRLAFTGLAFHPSGRFLAATSNDATVKLYDTSNWALATTYTWEIGRMRSVAFSPDGLLAAAGSDTGRVVVWDVDV